MEKRTPFALHTATVTFKFRDLSISQLHLYYRFASLLLLRASFEISSSSRICFSTTLPKCPFSRCSLRNPLYETSDAVRGPLTELCVRNPEA